MLFRATIAISYIIFVINVAEILHLDRFNPIQKSIFLVAALVYVFTRPVDKRIIGLLIVCLVMVLTLGALTDYPDFKWSIVFGGLNQFIVPYLLLAGTPTEKDRTLFLKLSVWLAPLSAAMGLFYQALGIYNAFPIEFNTGESRFSGTLNAAFLGGFAAIGVLASFKFVERGQRKYALGMLVNFVILVMSAGRMNFVVMILVLLPSFFLSARIKLSTKYKATALGILASIIIIPALWLRYADRIAKSGTSGRDIMWDWLLQMSAQYPNFGIGFAHQFWTTPLDVVIQVSSPAAHNDYLRILLELGTFGVVAFYLLLIAATLLAWNSERGNRDLSILFALLSFLLLSATDNALSTPCYFTLIITTIMASQKRVKTPRNVVTRPPRPSQPPGAAARPRSVVGRETVTLQEDIR